MPLPTCTALISSAISAPRGPRLASRCSAPSWWWWCFLLASTEMPPLVFGPLHPQKAAPQKRASLWVRKEQKKTTTRLSDGREGGRERERERERERKVRSRKEQKKLYTAPPSPRSWSPPRPHRHDDHLQLLRDLHGRHAMKASEGLTTQHAMETDTVGI